MLRSGYSESAKQLAQERGVEDLVDLGVFTQCQRIVESLRRGETKEALQWCGENKAALKKSQVSYGWAGFVLGLADSRCL
jgi:macrophage erythroblast attacher